MGEIWENDLPTTAKSSDRSCRLADEENFFLPLWIQPTIRRDTNPIWERSD